MSIPIDPPDRLDFLLYIIHIWNMSRIRRTSVFAKWLADLRDGRAKFRISKRIGRLTKGNLGDTKPVGEGISEMRIDYGPGYRVYYIERIARDIGEEIIILLCGGDKTSQDSDIEEAKRLARNLPEGLTEE